MQMYLSMQMKPIIASALTKICICLKYFKSREGHYIVLYNLIFK